MLRPAPPPGARALPGYDWTKVVFATGLTTQFDQIGSLLIGLLARRVSHCRSGHPRPPQHVAVTRQNSRCSRLSISARNPFSDDLRGRNISFGDLAWMPRSSSPANGPARRRGMLPSRLSGTAWGAKYRVHLAVSSPTACIVAGASVSPSSANSNSIRRGANVAGRHAPALRPVGHSRELWSVAIEPNWAAGSGRCAVGAPR